jgi:heme/copper-type cytochrome/quinol oxidase subunit 2
MIPLRKKILIAGVSLSAALLAVVVLGPARARAQGGQAREFTINGNQFAFAPARIEVQKDDLVKITFTAADIAHSFVIDNPYRIAKRAGSGQSVTFEFRADQAGTFPFYCNLTQDERCRQMKGQLVVK